MITQRMKVAGPQSASLSFVWDCCEFAATACYSGDFMRTSDYLQDCKLQCALDQQLVNGYVQERPCVCLPGRELSPPRAAPVDWG